MAYIVYRYCRRNHIEQLNAIRTRVDVLVFIQDIARVTKGTETMTEKLVALIEENSECIGDDTVARLSQLARDNQNQNDACAYAITMLWSCIAYSTARRTLAFANKATSSGFVIL